MAVRVKRLCTFKDSFRPKLRKAETAENAEAFQRLFRPQTEKKNKETVSQDILSVKTVKYWQLHMIQPNIKDKESL